MLAVGDLLWVPFVYSLQARYLVFSPKELGPYATAGILAVNSLGYYIFRSSNSEKNDFRNGKNPKSKHKYSIAVSLTDANLSRADLQFMQTERGTKLITSGWWGMSRHPNYLYVSIPAPLDLY